MGPAIQFCPPSSLQSPYQVIPSKVLSHRFFCNETTRPLSGQWLKSATLRPSILYYVPNLKLKNRTWSLFNRHVFTSAVGGEVALEEPTTESGAEQAALKEQLVPEGITDGQESLPEDPSVSKQRKQRVPSRRTRKVVVSEEDLVRGAIFTGKVTSIQPFGAFVDLGAFTNGLVHISRLSRSYVKAVEDVVKIGQEVSVQILEVNLDAGRIALRLREENEEELQNQGEGDQSRSSGVGRQVRFAGRSGQLKRDNRKIPSKFQKGQKLTGVVKNLVRSGVFVTLPEGEEGFLHSSEVTSGAGNVVVQSYFQVGQEVNVRVLEIEKGRLSLTMKQELDMQKLNLSINKNVIGVATNPFEIAFRQNAVIASYLEEKKRLQEAPEEKVVDASDPTELAAPEENIQATDLSEEEDSAPPIVSTEAKALRLDYKEDSAEVVDEGPESVNVLDESVDSLVEKEPIAATLPEIQPLPIEKAVIVSTEAKALNLDYKEDSSVDEGQESVYVVDESVVSLVEKEAIATPPEIQPLPSEKTVIEGTAEEEQEVALTSDDLVNATVENQGFPTAAEAQVSTSEEASEEVLEKGLEDDPLTLPTENLEVVQDQDATTVSAVADIASKEDLSVVENKDVTSSAEIQLVTTKESTNQELEEVQDVVPELVESANSLVEKQVPADITTRQEVEEGQDDAPLTDLSEKSDTFQEQEVGIVPGGISEPQVVGEVSSQVNDDLTLGQAQEQPMN